MQSDLRLQRTLICQNCRYGAAFNTAPAEVTSFWEADLADFAITDRIK
jgi:hypothetical protein